MAAKYRKIDPRIWNDEKFVTLIPREKLVALNALTGQSNRCGLFAFSLSLGAEQTGLAEGDSYAIALRKVCQTLGWKYDPKVKVLYMPTWWKYNQPENPKHLKGCLEDLHELPQTQLLAEFAANTQYLPMHSLETFRIAMQIAMSNQKQEQKQEQDEDTPPDGGVAAGAADAAGKKSTRSRKPASGAHHELVRIFCDNWKARYGTDYKFAGKKDGNHIKWILAATLENLSEAEKIVKAYLADDDEWIADKAHPMGMLVSHFNKYRVRAIGPESGVSNGHAHTPRRPAPKQRGLVEGLTL